MIEFIFNYVGIGLLIMVIFHKITNNLILLIFMIIPTFIECLKLLLSYFYLLSTPFDIFYIILGLLSELIGLFIYKVGRCLVIQQRGKRFIDVFPFAIQYQFKKLSEVNFQLDIASNLNATVQVAKRSELHRFEVMPQRWVVERSFSWLENCRRLWKNCERQLTTSLQMVVLAFLALLLKRFQTASKGKSYWVKIWHEKNNHARKRAATIVWKTYHSKNYKKIKYGFGDGLGTTSITYCSKMVYQAYSFQTNKHSNIGFYISNPFGAIVTPYHLDNYFPSHGKYKLIYRGRE